MFKKFCESDCLKNFVVTSKRFLFKVQIRFYYKPFYCRHCIKSFWNIILRENFSLFSKFLLECKYAGLVIGALCFLVDDGPFHAFQKPTFKAWLAKKMLSFLSAWSLSLQIATVKAVRHWRYKMFSLQMAVKPNTSHWKSPKWKY